MRLPKDLEKADRLHSKMNGANNFSRMSDQTIEECGEVQVALCHLKRDRCTVDEVFEEMADVIICINALVKTKKYQKKFQKIMDAKAAKYLDQMKRKFK